MAYNDFMRDYPKMTESIMEEKCRLGDKLKDEKRKRQFKYELGRLMGEYAVPLPLDCSGRTIEECGVTM